MKSRILWIGCAAVALLGCAGCMQGREAARGQMTKVGLQLDGGGPSAANARNAEAQRARAGPPAMGGAGHSTRFAEYSGPAAQQSLPGIEQLSRKIIYNAQVELVVERLSQAEEELPRLVRRHGGYIAEMDVGGTPGTPRSGRWKVRVPVTRFQEFHAALLKLGELKRNHIDSQDVTEEHYDLQARLRNKRTEERRLLQHLQRSTARLSDILQVEGEISRVRGEIEQLEGRLRLLSNLSELTTVEITVQEVLDYKPAQATTFGSEMGRTFSASVGALRDVGKGATLAVVALLPWLVVLVAAGLPLWIVLRRRKTGELSG